MVILSVGVCNEHDQYGFSAQPSSVSRTYPGRSDVEQRALVLAVVEKSVRHNAAVILVRATTGTGEAERVACAHERRVSYLHELEPKMNLVAHIEHRRRWCWSTGACRGR